jgi:DNA-binding LytR/AlgR family response regulator
MIRIAVCDDSSEYLQQTTALLEQWGTQKELPLKVDAFDNGDSLLSSLVHQSYDLILLDIIMPMLSGIDTCEEIRKENQQTKIVFLSVSPEFGVDAFRVKANGYLLKPLEEEAFFRVLDDCLLDTSKDGGFLVAKSASVIRKVPLNDICYVEAQNKQVLIYSSDGSILTVTTPLHQLSQQLEPPRFFQCHRSYIVNLDHIRSFSKNELTLPNGHTIPISRNCAKEFHDTYFAFLFGKAGDQ